MSVCLSLCFSILIFYIWSLCSSSGAGIVFEPYCGGSTNIEDANMGQGPNVIYDIVKKANIPKGSHIYMDNLFTSFPLLNKLSEMEIGGTGTIR